MTMEDPVPDSRHRGRRPSRCAGAPWRVLLLAAIGTVASCTQPDAGLASRSDRGVAAAQTIPSTTAPNGPERPRDHVDTTLTAAAGRTLYVAAGGDLQAALDAARPGDQIVLAAGATFTGPFVLPRKAGSEWIVVRTSALDRLPPAGVRVTPDDAALMAVLEAGSGSVLRAEVGAHHFRFIGLEIRPRAGTFLYNLVLLGSNERSVDQLPHHIIFDRCYLHGDVNVGTRRGIAMNSRHTAVIDSYLSDFKEVGADSQAIAGWNGPGPFRIQNNYLEGAGENLLFGGADPSIASLVPSDTEIRENHFAKPLAWRIGDRDYRGTPWTVKNLLELKNARRVLIEGNLFEYNWPHAQNGFAILFTVRNQDGGSPWSAVEDVTFARNVVRHVASAVNILGRDDIHTSRQTRRILIQDNLFIDVGGVWGRGRLFQLLHGTADVLIAHNTAVHDDSLVFGGDTLPHTGFVFRDNIARHNLYGVIGSAFGVGLPSIAHYLPGAVMRRNVITGAAASRYPADNFFPPTLEDVGFVDPRAGDYRLAGSSPYRGATTDGRDIGADVDAVLDALSASERVLFSRELVSR